MTTAQRLLHANLSPRYTFIQAALNGNKEPVAAFIGNFLYPIFKFDDGSMLEFEICTSNQEIYSVKDLEAV